MKYLLFTLTLLFSTSNFDKKSGIEIYQANWRSIDFVQKRKTGNYCELKISKEDLFDSPLLKASDIIHFDWDTQKLILTEKGQQKVDMLKIPLDGLAVAMVLNGDIIYGFWFWNSESLLVVVVYTQTQNSILY